MSSPLVRLCVAGVIASALPAATGSDPFAAGATQYLIRPIGIINWGAVYRPAKINALGQVVGTASLDVGYPFMWDEATGFVAMPFVGGGNDARSINSRGQVIGTRGWDGIQYLWSAEEGILELPHLSQFIARDINDSTVVSGTRQAGNGFAAIWTVTGGVISLPYYFPGGWASGGSGINNAGIIVGFGTLYPWPSIVVHALLWEEGSEGYMVFDLGSLGGPERKSWAVEISNAGYVVGDSETESGETHAFLWHGAMQDLGTLGGNSHAKDVNNHGQVVGYCDVATNVTRPFLYEGGSMADLNTLVVNGAGWELNMATSINDAGHIVGYGTRTGSGYTMGYVLVPAAGTVKWCFPTAGQVKSSPAVGPDGTVYVGSNSTGGSLYAVNPDGTLKWQYATGYWEVLSSPAVGTDGTVYVGSGLSLHAVNSDGSPKWQFATGNIVHSSPAIGTDGTIYVGSANGRLYAINPNGSLRWYYATDGSVRSSPAVAGDGTVYVGSEDQYLHAVNPDGTRRWRFRMDNYGSSSPAMGADGTVYMASSVTFYAINPDGTEKWHIFPGSGSQFYVRPSPAVGPDGTIYFGVCYTGGYDLHAVRPDGTVKWVLTPGVYSYSCPAVRADGSICVTFNALDGGKLRILNPDGSTRSDFSTLGNEGSPAIGPDGTIYVGSNDGYLYALPGSIPLAHSPWPMFRRDLGHSGRAARPGDVNRDGVVDIFDVIDTITAFAAVPGDPNWNAGADFDFDGQVTIFDVIDAINNFGTGG